MVRLLKRLAAALAGWIILLALFYGVLYFFLFSPPKIEARSILHFVAQGAIQERQPSRTLVRLLRPRQVNVVELLSNLRKASLDPRIEAMFVEIRALNVGWAKVEELHDAILEFRRSGKFVTAFLEHAGEKEYLLASAADKVSLAPSGHLQLDGIAASITFIKGLLDKIGVKPIVVHIGEYKTAAEPLTRETMSPPQREMFNAILDGVFERFIERVTAQRKLPRDALLAYINGGVYRPRQALEATLIDAAEYADEVLTQLASRVGRTNPRRGLVPLATYRRVKPSSLGIDPTHTIALVYGAGTIVTGRSKGAPGRRSMLGSQSFTAALRQAANDDEAEAIVLRIDSPGGSALASDLMWRAVHLARRKKPVVASMSDITASGGYYIAMAANRIVAQPLTLTGSIGILALRLNNEEVYRRLGLRREVVRRGAFASFADDSRPLTPEELARFRDDLQRGYEIFTQKAAQDRSLSAEQLNAVARGRVWTGAQAQEGKLVDVLGGLRVAVAEAKRLAGIPADADVRLAVYSAREHPLESLLSAGFPFGWLASLFPQHLDDLASIPRTLAPAFIDGPLALMPFDLQIR